MSHYLSRYQYLSVDIIVPDRVVKQYEFIEMVDLPTVTGRLSILKNHSPILTALEIGVLKLHTKTQKLSPVVVLGGVAVVKNNTVKVYCKKVETDFDTKDSAFELNVREEQALNQDLWLYADVYKDYIKMPTQAKMKAGRELRKCNARLEAISLIKDRKI